MLDEREEMLGILKELRELAKRAQFEREYPNCIYPIGPDGLIGEKREEKPKIGKMGLKLKGKKK